MPGLTLVTTSYPDDIPGNEAAGSFVEDLAVELSASVPVTVVAASRADSLRADGALIVRRFAVPRLPLSLLRPASPGDWPALIRSLRLGREALRAAILADAPDHVLALWALPGGWWANAEARPRGIPYSTWALGSDIWSLGRIPLIRTVLRKVLRGAAHRYADGLALCDDVVRLCGMPCEFLPSARRLPAADTIAPSAAAPYKLAFLGRWHRNKGIDLLLDALRGLTADDWSRIREVRICGGGPLEADVLAAVRGLAATGRPVTVGGYLDKPAAARLIGWADYLLLPSRIESIPVIFSDAAQLGTPLIATPVGDLGRLHERFDYGVLASGTDSVAIGAAIRDALHREPAAFRPGLQRASGEFSVAAIAARILSETGLR